MTDKHNNIKIKEITTLNKMFGGKKSEGTTDAVNNLTTDDVFSFMELYFKRSGIMFSHLHNSMNKFLGEDMKTFLENGEHIFYEKIDKNKIYKYKFKFENTMIKPPTMDNDIEPMFPSDARKRSLVYGGRLLSRVTQYQEIIDINTDEKIVRQNGHPEENVPIANIPIMVKSAYCSLNLYKGQDKTECRYDPGGYFIINGSEKVVIPQDRMCENKPLAFTKKDPAGDIYMVQVNSKSYKPHGIAQSIMIKMGKNNIITIRVPIISEIPVMILFKALGVETDRDIINYITYDENDHDMIDLLRTSMDECKTDKGIRINTREDALQYLTTKMRVFKKYTETDKNVKNQQKRLHLINLLERGFMPHIEEGAMMKGIYMGYMINRLLRCYLGRIPKDDRDSYINKRIDLPGILMEELFRQFYKKMMNECNKFFKKRNSSDEEPIVIINQIKPNIIEQGIKTALLTGSWIKKKGVAQMLQRYTYLQTLTFLRRVDAPSGDATSNTLTGPRHLHPSSARWLCCLTGDTEIQMADGSIKTINEVKNGEYVDSYTKELTKYTATVQNWFESKNEKILEIRTMTGNIIKCTLDHKLLINTKDGNIYIEATEMKIGDRLVGIHMSKYVDSDSETCIKSILMAKLVALVQTSGEIVLDSADNKYTMIINTDEHMNSIAIYDTINKLDFKYTTIMTQNKVITVRNTSELPEMLTKMGADSDTVPEWIINGSQNVKKAYLSTYIVNSKCEIYERNGKIYITRISRMVDKTEVSGKLLIMMALRKMLEGFNIVCFTGYEMAVDSKYEIYVSFVQNYTNIEKIANIIDFTYNLKKMNTHTMLISYVKYCNRTMFAIEYDKFNEKYNIDNKSFGAEITFIKQIPDEPVYDFETNINTHSFVANGIISHNCVQTPEHAKVGVTKHLSIIGNITILQPSQIGIIKSHLKNKLKDPRDISLSIINKYVKVFLNGEWLGLVENAMELYSELKMHKMKCILDPRTSICYDVLENDIRIYCDGGRGYIPSIIVKDNVIQLTKEHVSSITKNKIASWEEFMIKNPQVIEYIDMEEQPYMMIGDKIRTVELMRQRMITSKDKSSDTSDSTVNRYDDLMFIKYSHCDFHPSFLLGEIATNIPFCNSNQGPRNIYQYSQGRQAMGIYTSNYRDRLDISFVLYKPQRPLVLTRTSKFMHADMLPSGENVVVAILCYTGYNQEDSLIFNKSAIDRGLFRSMSLKKHISTVQKNQSTALDDMHIKPEPTKVAGGSNRSYDKLNESGFVPEETALNHNDIVICKVSPIPPVYGDVEHKELKIYKDSSEVYKDKVPAIVDKVWNNLTTNDGYPMIKTRVRSERVPRIGDKFCSRHGQKGTIGITLNASDMPFTKNGLQPDIILNPNAIPSRMTVAQLKECILGKVSALNGMDADGTPFNDSFDINEIENMLESLGYKRNGTEYLYNGMTGQKMKSMIFIGPTYYQRLKHLVEDKIHSRSRGPRTILTRQPSEGRTRDGGLRLGEMERDALLSHGIAMFINEKMLITSDAYTTYVCGICGLFCQRMYRGKSQKYITSNDIFYCNSCKNYTNIPKIRIPYAFKLLIQELMSMNIAPRIRTKKL